VSLRGDRYSVHVPSRSRIEYKDRDRAVLLHAGMHDGEVYLGQEEVTAGRMDPADREGVIERVYHHLNVTRGMGVRFLNPDGSEWQPRHRPDAGSAPDNTDRAAPSAWARLRRAFTNRGR
jgi:hypothetical protein